jgi:hypothetical protein
MVSENVRELIEQYHPFYEVAPYYIVLEARSSGTAVTRRRIQAGFYIDMYGIIASLEPEPFTDYVLAYTALQKVVETVLPRTSDRCSIEVIPFASSVILDTRTHLQPEAMLRIRIAHGRGIDLPAGTSEERALNEIEEKLRDLGVSERRSRA